MSEDTAFKLTGFDRYVEEHHIAEEDIPAAFALWIAQHMNGRVPRFEKRLSGSHRRTAS
jgi:hypothetical protein